MNKIKLSLFLISIEIAASLLLKQNFSYWLDDYRNCKREYDYSQCSAHTFPSKGFQCCNKKGSYKIDNKTEYYENCDFSVNPIKQAQDDQMTDNGKRIIKEYLGSLLFSDETSKTEMNYTCPDGKLDFSLDQKEFTQEEKEKYNDKNHCLYYYGRGEEILKINITKETCFNAILSTAGNSEVSCGFYETKLYFEDKTTESFPRCFLFNDDIFTNKNMGFFIKSFIADYAISYSGEFRKGLSKFQITMTNSKGKSATYDSETDSVTINNSETISSKFLNYKNLLIFILLFI